MRFSDYKVRSLIAQDPDTDDSYGYSIAFARGGAILAVGSEAWEENDQLLDVGAVYLYDKNDANEYELRTVIRAPDPEYQDFFGRSVALSENGKFLFVGAFQWEGDFADQGGVYVFELRGKKALQRGPVITCPDPKAGDLFGQSLTCTANGKAIAVGAINKTITAKGQGAVYIFDKKEEGKWRPRGQALTAPQPAPADRFGMAVGFNSDGKVLIVGADYHSELKRAQGAVYVFDRHHRGWAFRNMVVAPDASVDDRFGTRCVISHDASLLLVSAEKWDGATQDQGCVYAFENFNGVYTFTGDRLTAPDARKGDRFGKAVAINRHKNVIAIGAHQWDGKYINQGKVYLFEKRPTKFSATPEGIKNVKTHFDNQAEFTGGAHVQLSGSLMLQANEIDNVVIDIPLPLPAKRIMMAICATPGNAGTVTVSGDKARLTVFVDNLSSQLLRYYFSYTS